MPSHTYHDVHVTTPEIKRTSMTRDIHGQMNAVVMNPTAEAGGLLGPKHVIFDNRDDVEEATRERLISDVIRPEDA